MFAAAKNARRFGKKEFIQKQFIGVKKGVRNNFKKNQNKHCRNKKGCMFAAAKNARRLGKEKFI